MENLQVKQEYWNEEMFLVIDTEDSGKVFYKGLSELGAYKRYNELNLATKQIVWANVIFTMFHGYEFIVRYEVLKVIK